MCGRRGLLKREDGVAMIAVIGITAVVTVIALTAFVLSQQSLLESRRTQVKTQAFQVANAGIDAALADIQANGFVLDHYTPSKTGSVGATGSPDYMGRYEVTLEQLANSEYLAVSRGMSADGAVEVIKVKFFYMNLWEMNLAAGSSQSLTAGGGGITGTSNVTGPFYVLGDVVMGGTSFVHNGPFFVKEGNITLKGNAEIGSPSNPIRVYVTGTYPVTNFYTVSVSQAVPRIVLPVVDNDYMTQKWTDAKLESVDNKRSSLTATLDNLECTSADPDTYQTMSPPNSGWTRPKAPGASSHYKFVGSDAGWCGTLGAGATPLVIGGAGSWGSWWGDGHYTIDSHDDFAFDDTTNTLYIEGTVLVDGPITIAEDIQYKGNGTLIANGPITVNGAVTPLGGFASANLNKQALGLVTPTTITINYGTANTKDLTEEPDMAGAFFATEKIAFTANGVLFKGSIIAGNIGFAHPNIHLVTNPLLPAFLPDAMPGRGQSILVAGQWVRQ